MRVVVIDTSALIRLYVPDGPLPPALEETVQAATRAEATLLLPELAVAEVAQVLLKKQRSGFLQAAEADEILAAIMDLPMDLVGHRELLGTAMQLARDYALTVYDALFIALATLQRAEFITVDDALSNAWQRLHRR